MKKSLFVYLAFFELKIWTAKVSRCKVVDNSAMNYENTARLKIRSFVKFQPGSAVIITYYNIPINCLSKSLLRLSS